VSENALFASSFELKLIGAVSAEVISAIKEHDLDKYMNLLGYVSHEVALQEQKSSQVLLLIEINSPETKCIIPGKLFEYMVSERPILALGPIGADFEQIIKSTNTGFFFAYDEKEALKSQISNYFKAFQEKNLNVNAIGLQKYSRKSLTEDLARLLNSDS
jgi:hypothetical protein